MQVQLRRRHPLLAAMSFMAAIVAWMLFAPLPVGGRTAYVIVNGNSMEPGMRRGDLVLLRTAEAYQVGEVVTYRHPTIGPVIHRIIARAGERFVFQGDHNHWIDDYRPRRDELIGRLWIHIPQIGHVISVLRRPPVFALLTALALGSVLMATGTLSTHTGRRKASRPRSGGTIAYLDAIASTLIVLALLSLALGVTAFSQPVTQELTRDIAFTHHGRFSYRTTAPIALYEDGIASDGDTIFRRLSNSVAVRFDYGLQSDLPAHVRGSGYLKAFVSDGEGWSRTLPLVAQAHLKDNHLSLAGTIDLNTVHTFIEAYERLTGHSRPFYHLTLAPAITLKGQLGVAAIEQHYGPQLAFRLDSHRLRLDDTQALVDQEAGSITHGYRAANRLQLWLFSLDVSLARRLALIGLEIALVYGALLGRRVFIELRRDEDAAIRLQYGSLLVEGRESCAWMHEAIYLKEMRDLVRIAQQRGQPIIHVAEGTAAGYYVRDGADSYCYRPQAERGL